MTISRKSERKWRFLGGFACFFVAVVACVAAGTITAWWLAVVPIALAAMHFAMIGPAGTAVLTYHSVSPDPGWLPWSREIAVHPDVLAAHLETLAAMQLPVLGTREYAALRRTGAEVPIGTVLLHFDDGYLDNHVHAVPLLAAHGFAATFFASLDFIEPGDTVRAAVQATGYMNWPELRAIEAHPLLEVEPHGVDHARIPVSSEIVGHVTAQNWRTNAWVQWRAMPGPKHDWYRSETPPAVPVGSPIPQSGLALAVRGWVNGALESPADLRGRLVEQLTLCQTAFAAQLGRVPQIFCWPERKVGPEGREVAEDLGYLATTGGTARNCADEPAHVISRCHIGDRAVGFRWLPAERLHFRATVRLMLGNHYYYAIVAPMNLMRKLVFAWRRRFGGPFA